jgi:membrane-bound lytic murein transglycosylase MltF
MVGALLRRGLLVHLLVAVAGCDAISRLPRDPEGTLERVRGGVLRAGVSEHPPWTERAPGSPRGIEAELVGAFAQRLGARVQWVWGSEQPLLEALERRDLDVVVAGLKRDSPWAKRVGLTKPYVERARIRTRDGESESVIEEHVIAVAPGENGFLRELERFLRERRPAVLPAEESGP